MSPHLTLPIGGWVLPAYETLYAIALVGALLLGPPAIARLGGLPPAPVRIVVFVLTLAAFIGARAFFVATNWELFADSPLSAAAVWRGGRNAAAAVATLLVLSPLVVRTAGLPAARFCDAGVPVVSAACAIARVGCFLHGCCSGVVAWWPWCVTFPPGSAPYRLQMAQHLLARGAPASLPVHPLPLYFAGLAIVVGVIAIWWHRRERRDGDVTFGGTILFGLGSAALEWLRADHPARRFWAGVPVLQWLALSLALGATLVLVWRRAGVASGHRRETVVEHAVAARDAR
jgi:phosphatidylglycerol:prolipoprotein diacylglycerol transferase